MRGPETEKNHNKRQWHWDELPFYSLYCSGYGLDIGYKGSTSDAEPVLPMATGIDFDTPGYNGLNLPFADNSQDYVFTSHVLEHISDYKANIKEWFRVIKTYGYLILIVPHQFLYEKKKTPPSRYNEDHKRFYTPASLLREVEESLDPNTYRFVHLRDNDDNFDYSILPETHANGSYEIECVIQKINRPSWEIK